MKQLRGKKGEDVIFNGSSTKGQLGAEVTLILDNSDLPHRQAARVMSDYPEIAITRRLYRSGEGEYLINNSPARLFDIHLLLAKAQFAEHSYSVVGQGMIDRLLTVSTAERKDFWMRLRVLKNSKLNSIRPSLNFGAPRKIWPRPNGWWPKWNRTCVFCRVRLKKLERRQEVEL